jgi:hypothetical protein
MNWVWVIGGTWLLLAVLTAVLVGRAIRMADREETEQVRRTAPPAPRPSRVVAPLSACRRAGPSRTRRPGRPPGTAATTVAGCVTATEQTPTPRRSDPT